ncbi:UNVERIFIED_CONTAM: hypothetical protein NCL1_57303 [Trichonephila clavipes]
MTPPNGCMPCISRRCVLPMAIPGYWWKTRVWAWPCTGARRRTLEARCGRSLTAMCAVAPAIACNPAITWSSSCPSAPTRAARSGG